MGSASYSIVNRHQSKEKSFVDMWSMIVTSSCQRPANLDVTPKSHQLTLDEYGVPLPYLDLCQGPNSEWWKAVISYLFIHLHSGFVWRAILILVNLFHHDMTLVLNMIKHLRISQPISTLHSHCLSNGFRWTFVGPCHFRWTQRTVRQKSVGIRWTWLDSAASPAKVQWKSTQTT